MKYWYLSLWLVSRLNILFYESHPLHCYFSYCICYKCGHVPSYWKQQTRKDTPRHYCHPIEHWWAPWKNFPNPLWFGRQIRCWPKGRRWKQQSFPRNLWRWPCWPQPRTCQLRLEKHRTPSRPRWAKPHQRPKEWTKSRQTRWKGCPPKGHWRHHQQENWRKRRVRSLKRRIHFRLRSISWSQKTLHRQPPSPIIPPKGNHWRRSLHPSSYGLSRQPLEPRCPQSFINETRQDLRKSR